jgi:hypothetical protein
MRGKITKRSVDALKAAADGAEAVLWDTELKGFGARACSAAEPRATCCTTAPAAAGARRCAS